MKNAERTWRMRAKVANRYSSDNTVTRLSRPNALPKPTDVLALRRSSAPVSRMNHARTIGTATSIRTDLMEMTDLDLDTKFHAGDRSASAPLGAPLQDPLHELALKRLFFDLVIPPRTAGDSRYGLRKGHRGPLEELPSLMAHKGRASAYLEASTKAFAFANFAGRQRSQEALFLSAEWYGKALRLVNTALQDRVVAAQDDTLLSVHLLAILEVSFHHGILPHRVICCFTNINWYPLSRARIQMGENDY